MNMRDRKYLFEDFLKLDEIREYNKRWHAISDNHEMDPADKRKAYDDVYDEVTDKFFDNVHTFLGYDKIKKFMRKAWLKYGFEVSSGEDKRMNLARSVSSAAANNNTQNVIDVLNLIVNNLSSLMIKKLYSSVDAQRLLSRNESIWEYDKDTIIKGLKLFIDASSEDKNKLFKDNNKDGEFKSEVKDMKEWDTILGASPSDEAETIEFKKLDDDKDKRGQEIIDLLNKAGIDWKNASDLDLLDNITKKARNEI